MKGSVFTEKDFALKSFLCLKLVANGIYKLTQKLTQCVKIFKTLELFSPCGMPAPPAICSAEFLLHVFFLMVLFLLSLS